MNKYIGFKIRDLRKGFGLSQDELANNIGISRSTLSGYEQQKSQPDIETLVKIADFFSVSSDYLLGIDESYSENDNFLSDLIYMGKQLSRINRIIIMGEIAKMVQDQKIEYNKKDIS